MPGSPWQELGITPTADRNAIRRAYAARLKMLDLQREPAAFQRLREAYEAAFHGTPRQTARPPERKYDADTGAADIAAGSARAAIAEALDRGDFAGAFAALEAGETRGLIALADIEPFERRLLAASGDRALPLAALIPIVRRFQWDSPLHKLRRRHREFFAQLDARLDAERWYDDLAASAARKGWLGRNEDEARRAARQMLAGPPGMRQRHLFPRRSPLLVPLLAHYDLHAEWVGSRFDPARIAWCRKARRRRPKRPVVYLAIVAIWVVGSAVQTKYPVPLLLYAAILAIGGVIYWRRRRRTGKSI